MVESKKSLDDIVYEKLKKAIILQKFPPNTKLVESELADILKVSRTPVHTALKLLEKDGLLAIVPNKGAFVTKKTYDEVEEAFAVRVELEKMSARLAAKNINEVDIIELREILDKEEQAYKRNKRIEAYTIGAEFHKKIAKISGNKCLMKFVNDIVLITNRYDVFYILNDPMLEKEYFTPKQHYDILAALIMKDASKAERAMETHILSTEAQLNLVYFEEENDLESLLNEHI